MIVKSIISEFFFSFVMKDTQWRKVLLEIEEVVPFQLIFEVYKNSDLPVGDQQPVGFDGLEITYGNCDQTELRRLEEEDRKNNLRSFVPLSNYPHYRLKRSFENFKDSNPSKTSKYIFVLQKKCSLIIFSF